MADQVLLETLVKLASLGTSGVCIFAIFWSGWLLHVIPEKATERLKTVRFYMVVTAFIAFISAGSGGLNAYFNAKTIVQLRGEKSDLSNDLAAVSSTLTTTSTELNKQKRRSDQLEYDKKDLSGKLALVSGQLTKENLRAKGLEGRVTAQEKQLTANDRLLADAEKAIETLWNSKAVQADLSKPESRTTVKSLDATLKAIRAAKVHHP